MSLSIPEITLIAGLVFLMGLESYKAIQSGSWVQVYRPTLFVAVFLSFYALVGPLRALLAEGEVANFCLLYTSPSPRDGLLSRMPSSA